MKFIFVSYNYSPNFSTPLDWIKHIKFYVGALEQLSKKHAVTRIEQINYKGDYFLNGVNYRFTDLGRNRKYIPSKLNRFIKSLQPDVIVVHGTHYPLAVIHLRFILNKNTRIIVQHHAEKPFVGIKKYFQKLVSVKVDAFLFAAFELGLDWVKKGNIISSKKIYELMEVSSDFYPIDKELALSKTKAMGTPLFLWVGRLNDNKDPLNVVKAFLNYSKSNKSARLYMIYHTDELLGEINALLAANSEVNPIILIGKVSHHELLYWYNCADFIISGSYYEGSGTAICEAMSCGCVPIVTNIDSFRMITNNGECGIIYEAGNESALLEALKISQDIDTRDKINKCLAYFKSKLSFDAIANGFEDIAAKLNRDGKYNT